ncbi:Histone acetyltransferase KAT5 [Porphyridium purpureum]|uniref:Histone acetyltransferase n=1 Tax=Porphyridium purpureum TaxID=35688 RepID=A0A5J4Z5S2_PORPP|nr:Histone acetyltransferase KAT5 [Porphyridium purpureum]|eukprot:POR0143..scf295_1
MSDCKAGGVGVEGDGSVSEGADGASALPLSSPTSSSLNLKLESRAAADEPPDDQHDNIPVNATVPCRWRDGEFHMAQVVEKRPRFGGRPGEFEFYIHFEGFNRRLDEWVRKEQLDLERLKKPKVTPAKKSGSKKSGKGKKKDSAKNTYPEGSDTERPNDSNDEPASPTTGGRGKENIAPQAKGAAALSSDGKRKRESEAGDGSAKKKKSRSGTAASTGGHDDHAHHVKNISTIVLGKHEMNAWYYSPFPEEFEGCSRVFFCEFCLKMLHTHDALIRHSKRCVIRHPLGIEIYRKDNVSMWEIDGEKNRTYCRNLCYIAKLFLDHKTLYYDVDPFLFYIMTESDEQGHHLVGYFSKEKQSEENYNVACILTLPAFQRKGYGKFLISFSYELSKLENKVGSPEKPLSDLGLLGYRSFWSQLLIDLLKNETSGSISIEAIRDRTMMKTEDIIGTLQVLELIQYYEGLHIIDMRRVMKMKLGSRGLLVDPSRIQWTPPLPYNS